MHIIIFNKEVLKADVLCYGFTAKDFEAERKGKKNTNRKCNQQSRGKKVFGYASRPPIMSEHRFYWGLRYHLANVGVFFFFCFVLSVDTHISFSHPPWQAASCVHVSILSVKHFSSINHLITHSSISKMKMTQWITLESTTVVELASAEGVPAITFL